MILTQLRYDLKMFFRELFYLVFTVIVPPVSYLFMGQIFGNESYGSLNYAQFYTPSYIILITFSVIFFSFGFDNVMNRSLGIEKRINVTPINDRTLIVSSILKSIIVSTLGFISIFLLGVFVYGLEFNLIQLTMSYGFFLFINVTLLIFSLTCYSFFKEMKSALIFSIVTFQIVMFTGDFSIPIANTPKFVQYAAKVNPIYHLNHLFIDVWNKALDFNKSTVISLSYIAVILVISLIVLLSISPKRRGNVA